MQSSVAKLHPQQPHPPITADLPPTGSSSSQAATLSILSEDKTGQGHPMEDTTPRVLPSSRSSSLGGGAVEDQCLSESPLQGSRGGSASQSRGGSAEQSVDSSPMHKLSSAGHAPGVHSNQPLSLTDLQNPNTFRMDATPPNKKKITKANFANSMGSLTGGGGVGGGVSGGGLVDTADPLSMLDPLWTLKSKAMKTCGGDNDAAGSESIGSA